MPNPASQQTTLSKTSSPYIRYVQKRPLIKYPLPKRYLRKYLLPKRYLRKHLLPKRFLMKRHLPKRPLTIRSQRQTASDTKHPLRKFKRFSFSRLSSSNFLFKFFSVLDTSKSHLSLPPFLHLIYFHKIPFFSATF